ncbi:MAG: alpha/beta hydrolase [Acidimicrobiales bacterium]
MPFVDARGLSIHYEIHGAGPPLLHISGSGGDLRKTMPAQSALNHDFEGLHYDQRGLGQTSHGDGQPTMADFADDAAALCDALGWSRCHVVGSSFGGMVAQHVAIRHPDLVDKLVLNCTSPGGDLPSYPLHELQLMAPADRADSWMPLLDTRYVPGEDIPGLGSLTSYFRDGQATEQAPDAAAGFTRQLEARRLHDANPGLPGVTAPTLVCAGRYDGIAPVSNSEAIVAAMLNAELDVFEGGHIFMMQDPRAMTRIRDFLLG